jgi:hypothetical protein
VERNDVTDWEQRWDERIAEALDDEREQPEQPERSEPTTAAAPPIPLPPLNVAVVGSTGWDDMLVVQAALLGWYQRHLEHPVILWTTGAPDGAEDAARDWGTRNGWSVGEMMPDQMIERDVTVTFAFVTPQSEAHALAIEIGHRRPVRLFVLDTLRPVTRWAGW